MTSVDATRLGPYEIIRELGRGGMGVVRLARDTRLDRTVAIKSLPPEVASDPDRLARFEREARSLAQLNHPNIAAVYGLEEFDGHKYLVMEYVDGETLASRIARGPIPVDEALDIAIEISRGIESAHEAGVIHRDLKPDNIATTPDGKVKVLDFGLAKSMITDRPSDISDLPTITTPQSPTIPGAIMGTAGYMSPEQARGRPIDKRTDIWAFGAVLYQMLTGVNPFAGETVHDTIGAVLHRDVDLGRLPPRTPPQVRRLISRCLQRDRTNRIHDIGDARLELEEARSGPGPADPVPSPRRSPALAALGWIAAALALASLAWVIVDRAHTTVPLVRTAVLGPPGIAIEDFRFSPDGARVAVLGIEDTHPTDDAPRVRSIFVRDLADTEMVRVPGADGALSVRFSPDSRTLAFITRGPTDAEPERFMRCPADLSSPPVEVMRVPVRFHNWRSGIFCWTPRGEIAFWDDDATELVIVDANTGREIRRVKAPDKSDGIKVGELAGPFGDRWIHALSPAFDAGRYRVDAILIDIDTGRRTKVLENAVLGAPMEGGTVTFARQGTIFRAPFDSQSLAITPPFEAVQSGLDSRPGWPNGIFFVARTGALAYISGSAAGSNRRIVMVDRDGTETPWSDDRRAFESYIAASPDGSRLAVLISNPGGIFELWASETAHPRLRKLYADPETDCYGPVFTPDGRNILATVVNPKTMLADSIIMVPFDGAAAPRQIECGAEKGRSLLPYSVSADGTRVLVYEEGQTTSRVHEVRLDNGAPPRTILELPQPTGAFYPPTDVPLLAYSAKENGRNDLYVCTLDASGTGPPVPVSSEPVARVNWAVDPQHGLCLLYFDNAWKEWRTPIALENGVIRIGEPVQTGRTGNYWYDARAAMRDGRQFAIRYGEDEKPPTHIDLVQGWAQSIDKPKAGVR